VKKEGEIKMGDAGWWDSIGNRQEQGGCQDDIRKKHDKEDGTKTKTRLDDQKRDRKDVLRHCQLSLFLKRMEKVD
jgi:hypothetical protein